MANENATYTELRKLSRDFREGINALFFDQHPQLRVLIRKFGVF